MLVRQFRADRFRNLRHVALDLSPQVNLLVGPNGQGKTNVLEALYLLGGFRSFRGARNRELLPPGAAEAVLYAQVEADQIERTVEVKIGPKSKQYLVDGKAPGSLSEWVGRIVMVTFSPDDLFLIKGEPELRRRWLDRVIFLVDPEHLRRVMHYQKALRTRNALLKDGMFGRDLMLLDTFDETLARVGSAVSQARKHWCERLSNLVASEVEALTNGAHRARLGYDSEVSDLDAQSYLDRLIKRREEDVRRRLTGFGAHHDDVAVVLSDRDARRFASQGEQRALTLALKLGETRLLREERHVEPVLLLDDVAGELDEARHGFLYKQLDSHAGQVFVAGTERPKALAHSGRESRIFAVLAGEIRQEN